MVYSVGSVLLVPAADMVVILLLLLHLLLYLLGFRLL
jgi:hypothetical protein